MYANTIIFFEKKKDVMEKVCRLTGNTKLGKNGFISANTASNNDNYHHFHRTKR